MRSLIIISFLGGSLVSAQAANPLVEESWKYYEIEGTTIRKLTLQMRAFGPKSPRTGRPIRSETRPKVKVSGNCQVKLKLVYNMPRWVNRGEAPASVRRKWDGFYAALKRHERGHASLYRAGARELVKADCNGVSKIWRKSESASRRYDRTTRGGYLQGARLPRIPLPPGR